MSSRRGGGKSVSSNASNSPSSKGSSVAEASNVQPIEQLTHSVTDLSLASAQEDSGGWEVFSKKSKNRSGTSKAWGSQSPSNTAWGSQGANNGAWGSQGSNNAAWGSQGSNNAAWGSQGSTNAAWGSQNLARGSNVSVRAPGGSSWSGPVGRGNARPQSSSRAPERSYMVGQPQPTMRPPLEHGWRGGSSLFKGPEEFQTTEEAEVEDQKDDENDDDLDALDDTDDELLSDDFDSDTSQQSFESRKRNRWFSKFFESLDSLTVEEINEPARQWHCPACRGGPGAIDWYRGLQPLMTHAKTKGSKRVKLHRELAELLDEELRRRGTSVIPPGEMFGKWRGLKDEEKDHEIVWPPMVIIMNTKHEKDENDKWIGMGNQELLDYFSSYAAVRARHSYGPQGHRGMSVLIFESSAGGYLEAERLHKHFAEQGTDKNAWERQRKILFHAGGKRQLYGYMAEKEDLEIFNQHSQGKTRLKYELRSYQEMVVDQIRQMSEDNQQLLYFKNRVVREQKHSKALEESFMYMSEKLRKTMEENRIVRQRTKLQHEQNKEEMDFQEQFFKEQIEMIRQARNEEEENFEKLQQEERNKVKQSIAIPDSSAEVLKRVEDEITNFISSQDKEMEGYAVERDRLIKASEEKVLEMKKRHGEEAIALEKELNRELAELMLKYKPKQDGTNTNENSG